MKVLVTGAHGFIGTEVCRVLAGQGMSVRALVRTEVGNDQDGIEYRIATLGQDRLDPEIFVDVDCVVHLAGRAHVLNDQLDDPLAAFRMHNRDATVALAEQALACGVRRFVFMSSIGVNGAETFGMPFTESTQPQPHADYALSKYEAELLLQERLTGSGMELVIIRPPMVYGLNAPGNFGRLLKLVSSRIPLPFGAVKNQRSLISRHNLALFTALCVSHPSAAGEVFLICDGTQVSTGEIVQALAAGMRGNSILVPVPPFLMRACATVLRKKAIYTQLCGSLVIDASKARRLLGWTPSSTTSACLAEVGAQYARQKVCAPEA